MIELTFSLCLDVGSVLSCPSLPCLFSPRRKRKPFKPKRRVPLSSLEQTGHEPASVAGFFVSLLGASALTPLTGREGTKHVSVLPGMGGSSPSH